MENRYRLIFTPAIEVDRSLAFSADAKSAAELLEMSNTLANYTLFLQHSSFMSDFSNSCAFYQFIEGEWVELCDDELEEDALAEASNA